MRGLLAVIGMEHVRLADLERVSSLSPATVLTVPGRALGTTDVAINYFELEPGDALGYDYHRHRDQEEVFFVRSGIVTFRTESGPVAVSADELIRFGPDEFQLGENRGTDRAVVLGLGAPAETTEIQYRRRCPACEAETLQEPTVDRDARTITIACVACETDIETHDL